MSGSLDEFLGHTEEVPAREPETKQEPEPQQAAPEPEAKPEPEATEPKPEGEPQPQQPEREDARRVPVAALEAERRKRQEREAEAADLRRQLDEFRRQQQQPPQQAQPQREMTDEERFIARVQEDARHAAIEAATNRELNRSETLARSKYGDEAVDAALVEYQRVYAMAPQIQQVVLNQPDPFAFIVEQSAHVREVGEFSRNGSAYRQRLEAELRAKWEAEMAGQAQQQPQQPQRPAVPRQQPSLANARSGAPRAAAPYSGPTPLEDILPGTARR